MVGVLARIGLSCGRLEFGIPAIWPADSPAFALLLVQRSKGLWRPGIVIAASMIGIFAACIMSGVTSALSVQASFASGVEISAGTALAWLPYGPSPRLRRLDGLLKLVVTIGIVAPAIGALIGAIGQSTAKPSQFMNVWYLWFASHALGNLIFTAGGIVALGKTRPLWRMHTTPLSAGLALVICFVLVAAIFEQGSVAGLLLLPVLFAFLGMVAGFELSCIGVVGLTSVAVYRTAMGHGPIVTLEPDMGTMQILILQSIICVSFLSSVPIALAFERRARMISKLRSQKAAIISRAAQYKVLADISADTILVTSQDGTILYASLAAERLLGIAGSALTGRSAFDLIHPDDRKSVRAAMASLGAHTREVTAELRLRQNESATPVWTEVKTRIGERRADLSVELVSVVRDISARRANDDRRNADLVRLDQLANTDTLTGLANRRRFNDHLDQEWRRAMRDQLDIALILIDVDLFKAYNDCYGHPAGDMALQKLARIVAKGAMRPTDLASRIGGEEFAVILPSTFLSGARAVAERIRDGIRDVQLAHEKSPSGYLSVSIGIECLCPTAQISPQLLMERADQALYRAKTRRGSIVIAT